MGIKAIDKLMRQAVAEGIFPGGVLLVSAETEVVFFEAFDRFETVHWGRTLRISVLGVE